MTNDDDASLDRHEEDFRVGKRLEEIGGLRLKTSVSTDEVEGDFDRGSEEAEISRVPVDGADSGRVETLSDGSISIPVFEEELVVSRRLVVRERIVVTKHTVTTTERVRGQVRKETVDVERLGPAE